MTVGGEAFERDITQLDRLFFNMADAFSYQNILLDADGKPVDYAFIEVNPAFAELIGLGRDILGKKASKAGATIGEDTAKLAGIFGMVTTTGQSMFETYSSLLNKRFSATAYCPRKGFARYYRA